MKNEEHTSNKFTTDLNMNYDFDDIVELNELPDSDESLAIDDDLTGAGEYWARTPEQLGGAWLSHSVAVLLSHFSQLAMEIYVDGEV